MNRARIHSLFGCSAILIAASSFLGAAEITIPKSSLVASGGLYSNTFGNVVVTTGGGNAANAGNPSGRNDDGFSGPINLGFSLNFFGTNQTQFFINNNGSISFGSGISAFIPTGPTGANAPIISAFFADVDTRGAASGVVHLQQNANEDIITWDHVGYFDAHDDKLDTFQMVLRGPGASIPAGEGQIGFYYSNMQWDNTDTSHVAAIGFGDGAGNGQILEGSLQPGTAAFTQNSKIWFSLDPTGTPVAIEPEPSNAPEPGTLSLFSAGAVAVLFLGGKRLLGGFSKSV